MGIVAAYVATKGRELNNRRYTLASMEGVPGLPLRFWSYLANPCHWVLAADSVPYLGSRSNWTGRSPCSTSAGHTLRRYGTCASTPSRSPM